MVMKLETLGWLSYTFCYTLNSVMERKKISKNPYSVYTVFKNYIRSKEELFCSSSQRGLDKNSFAPGFSLEFASIEPW